MPLYRCLQSIPYFSGAPEDQATNTLYFQTPDGTSLATALSAMEVRLDGFWSGVGPYMSKVTNGTAFTKVYDMADPEPRRPVGQFTSSWTVNVAAINRAEELAVVLSFQAPAVSGAPQARRRGRIYLGPLNASAFSETNGAAFVQVAAAFRTELANRAIALSNPAVNAAAWVVYSPTSNEAHFVSNGWIDVQPDVQRRRGHKISGRTLWTSP